MQIGHIRNNHLLNVIHEIKESDGDIIEADMIAKLYSELMLATFISPACGAGLLRIPSSDGKLAIPVFTSMNEYNLEFDGGNIGPVPWKFANYIEFLDDENVIGIIINPHVDDFFVPQDMIEGVFDIYPDFNSYNNLNKDFTHEELNEIFNKDTIRLDFYSPLLGSVNFLSLFEELSKENIYTYIATRDDLSEHIDGNIIKTSDVNSQGIFSVADDGLEGCYIFTSPKYFQPIQSFHEKQGWKLFALPTTIELMAKYIIELDMDLLVVNPQNDNILIEREDLFKYLDFIIQECGNNIKYLIDDYSFALTDAKAVEKTSPTKTLKGYDVKVRLDDFRPLTWRNLIIPSNITFEELDNILKTLWGFNGMHLSAFRFKNKDLFIMDKDMDGGMLDVSHDSKDTYIEQFFDSNKKIFYWYDFGDDWNFTIEIKKKIDYDKDYVTIKRYKGEYNPIEDCGGVYGLSETIYHAQNPDENDGSVYCENVEYLETFDMEYTQKLLKDKDYVINPFKK